MRSNVENKLRPEIQLLLHCTRTKMENDRAQLVRALLRQNLDWAYLMKEATRQVIRPLLYANLQGMPPDPEVTPFLSELHQYYCDNATRNLFLANELIRLINLFEQHGITAVPFKGPVLAASVYGSLSLREFADLDIFVHKHDLTAIKKILLTEGYQLSCNENQEAFYLKYKHHFPFLHPKTGIFVEIHWNLTKPYWSFKFYQESLWERLKPVAIADASVWDFSAEDLLLILCMHGTKHGWERLAWVCDVAELIRAKEDLDWDWVMEQAKRTGILRMLFIGFSMARDLLETTLPHDILTRMHADSASRSVVAKLEQQIFSGVSKMKTPYYFIQTRERLRDKIRAFFYYFRVSLRAKILKKSSVGKQPDI